MLHQPLWQGHNWFSHSINMDTLRITALAFALIAISSCRDQTKKVETTLYFGLSKPDGTLIADSSWRRFEREEILPLFPEGFTVLSAQGVWKGSTGLVEESSRVVVFVHPENELLSDRIDSLRKRYQQQFQQDAVLRTDDDLERLDLK